MPVHMNLKYDRRGPTPRQNEGPKNVIHVQTVTNRAINHKQNIHGPWCLYHHPRDLHDLPGTIIFSEWPQVSSSSKTSSNRVPVPMEMLCDFTMVVFCDMETRSAITASKPTGVIIRSHVAIRSIGTLIQHQNLYKHNDWCKRLKLSLYSVLSLYRQSERASSQVRVMQKSQQSGKIVNNTLVTLRVGFVPAPLSVLELSSVSACSGTVPCWSELSSWVIFNMLQLVMRRGLSSFQHQTFFMCLTCLEKLQETTCIHACIVIIIMALSPL